MNKKERRLALATALQAASADMVVVESLSGKVEDKKTKSLLALLEKVRRKTQARQHAAAPMAQQAGTGRTEGALAVPWVLRKTAPLHAQSHAAHFGALVSCMLRSARMMECLQSVPCQPTQARPAIISFSSVPSCHAACVCAGWRER